MQDIQLCQQLLGLSGPWAVVRVTMKREAQEIEVEVRCLETVWGYPTCGKQMQGHGQEERRWRHLDSCQFKTLIVCAVPRVRCLEHGTQQVAVPWAERRSRFTRLFERLAMDVLLECSVLGAGELLGISWAEADGIKQRAVARGLARKPVSAPARLCVDEKSAGHGQELPDDRGQCGGGALGHGGICGRGTQTGDARRVLAEPHASAADRRGGRGDGLMGTLFQLDSGACAGRCE